jgi:hypothetical protein
LKGFRCQKREEEEEEEAAERTRESFKEYKVQNPLGPVLFRVRISTEQDLEATKAWCKSYRMKNVKIKKVLRSAKHALKNPDLQSFVWLYLEFWTEPPESLVRVQLEVCTDSSVEVYTLEEIKAKEYTDKDIDEIVKTITSGNTLNGQERNQLEEVVRKNFKAFSRNKGDLGFTTLIEHEIDVLHETPVKMRPYKHSFEEQKAAAEYIQNLIKEEQVQPSKSPWSSLAFLVPKKELGTFRMVGDYRKLNDLTRPWSMPLPYMSDLQQQLERAHYFAIMDITSGFYNVPMKEEHKPYTPFCLRNLGLFEWLVMPMGLKNAPATVTRLQEMIFPPLEWSEFLKIFIDDLSVFADSIGDLAERLDRVLGRLIWARLKLAPGKCESGTESVEFLGHVILHGQVTMSKRKTDAVSKLQPPTNVNELQQILGLLQYYRIFIPKFAHLARPMTRLLSKKVPFVWSGDRQKSFEFLKEALCSSPVPTCYDSMLTLVLDTDYQKNAISAILGMRNPDFKREQVIEYASRTLNATEQIHSATEGELAAVI